MIGALGSVTRFSCGSCYGLADSELWCEACEGRLCELPALDHRASAVVHRCRRRTLYRATLPLRTGPTVVFIKEHLHNGTRRSLSDGWVSRRPERAARAARALTAAGFHTFLPIATVHCRSADSGCGSWLVFRPVQGTALEEWLATHRAGEHRERVLNALANEVARLHEAGFWHGDLKAKNVVLATDDGNGSSREPALAFVDLDGLGRCPWWLPAGLRLRACLDLRTLVAHLARCCSPDELAQFQADYCAARHFGPRRRRVLSAVVRFPHKAVTRHDRAKARRTGQELPRGQNRLFALLGNSGGGGEDEAVR